MRDLIRLNIRLLPLNVALAAFSLLYHFQPAWALK